jgi:hypothetical protein
MKAFLEQLAENGTLSFESVYTHFIGQRGQDEIKFESNGMKVEIYSRELMQERRGKITLGAHIKGDLFAIATTGISINLELVPDALRVKLLDRRNVIDCRTIIDHPYLTATFSKWGKIEGKYLVLQTTRAKARYVLEPEGIRERE